MTAWWAHHDTIASAVEQHGTPTQAAKELGGISERRARQIWREMELQNQQGAPFALSSVTNPTASASAEPAEIVALKRKIDRLETSKRELEAQVKSGVKTANLFEDVRELAAPLLDQYSRVSSPEPSIELNQPRRSTPVEMVVYLTDWHIGDVIRPEEVEGRNEYNLHVAAQRVQHIGLVLAEWLDNYSSMHPVSRITFVGGGDLVNNSGMLHSDQSTDYARVLVQALDASLLLRQLIEPFTLIRGTKTRWVSTAGGNHGRSTRKMPSGPSAAQTSWDQVAYEHLAAQLQNHDVEWIMGRNYSQTFDVASHTAWFAHGHALRGGGGALGIPAYGARRSSNAAIMASVIAAIDEACTSGIIKYARIGHFHQRLEMTTPTGDFRICPSIKGAGPWEMEVLGAISNPECLFEVFHPEFGIIGSHTIDCSRPRGDGYVTGAMTSTDPVALLA